MRGQFIISFIIATAAIFLTEVECQTKYFMEANKSVTFDCSSLSGDVEFFTSKHGKTEFDKIVVDGGEKAEKNEKGDKDKASPSTSNLHLKDKKLEFNQLYKEDLNMVFKCENKDGANITFSMHPQFTNDAEYRPKMNVLSSSFRLLLTFDVQNANCSWRYSPKANNSQEIEIKESKGKYVVDGNSLQILKPDSEDSGIYVCDLKNNYGYNFRTVDITVKNELMALWPFLIILAQVLLCSGMFFIWEKRCNRKESSNEYSFEHAYNKSRQDTVA